MKQAVILAAGQGSRLTNASRGLPKCMLKVGGATLIERQLRVLRAVGINRICVVVGYRAGVVCEKLRGACDFITNDAYAETNSLYSLWLARKWVRGSFVLMNCDVLAHPDVYHRVLAVNGSALAYDSASGDQDEHMKVSIREGIVHSLGKDLPSSDTDGENVGILQFSAPDAHVLFDEADLLVGSGGDRKWAPAAVHRLARRHPVRAVDVSGLPWTEIDFPDDLAMAREHTFPRINNGQRAGVA